MKPIESKKIMYHNKYFDYTTNAKSAQSKAIFIYYKLFFSDTGRGVDFTNMFTSNFFTRNLCEKKLLVKRVGEISPRCQFHQHFMSIFFI